MSERMKKYIRSVQRRLNLPEDMKKRVVSDFESAILARQESGMSDEEVYAELGTPKQAAAELNEQMKEFAYRKSPWRFPFAAMAVCGAAKLLGELVTWILLFFMKHSAASPVEAASIGIIGGADGPTAIFITASPGLTHFLVPVLLVAGGIWGFLRLSRCKGK